MMSAFRCTRRVLALTIVAGLIFSCVPPAAQSAPPSSGPVEVGAHKQLFLDDALIASASNVTRRIQTAEKSKSNPVIRTTEPWEDPLNVIYGSVIRDGNQYRMWYKNGRGVAVATSDDGVHWVKPQLDFTTINGAKTNILFQKKGEFQGADGFPYYQELFGVFKDEHETDPARRYKMGFLSIDWQYKGPQEGRYRKGQKRGLGIATSPDGLHWKLVESFASEGIVDGATHWMHDPVLGKFVLYGRSRKMPPEIVAAWSQYDWYKQWYSGRAVGRLESSDFLKWNLTAPYSSKVVLTADLQDPPGTEIYSMLVFPYEGVYIGLVQAFLARPETPLLEIQLAISRDGEHFTRVSNGVMGATGPVNRAALIPAGPVGSWDRFNQSLANNPPIAVGDELRIYYSGRTYRHTPYKGNDTGPKAGSIGFATIPRDRFVSLEASFDGGQIVTKPLKLTGQRLHLNAKSDFGEILVDALDSSGQTIAKSKPIRRDSLDSLVEWDSGDFRQAAALRITLKNACLYALWCD